MPNADNAPRSQGSTALPVVARNLWTRVGSHRRALGLSAAVVLVSAGAITGGVVAVALQALGAAVTWVAASWMRSAERRRGEGGMSTAASRDGLAWVLEACPDALVLTSLDGVVLAANRPAAALLGAAARPSAVLVAPDLLSDRIADRTSFAATLGELYARDTRPATGEITVDGPEGLRLFAWVSEPVRDEQGVSVGRGLLFRDRTQERELAALKSDFLSTVTHELRTPLTSVKGSLQLVLGKAAGLTPIDRELLDISLKNTDRLIRLINDILDISQLELGKIDLSLAALPPSPLVEEAVAGLRAYAAGRDIAIGYEVEPDLPVVDGDRDRLIQVFTNLISNAVKFSPAGGRVCVGVARAGQYVGISIRDWGVGIRSSDQRRLFQRFHRINPGSSAEPGTGLGLAISKAIIERHGGRIVVDSREGEGSTFTVLVPVSNRAQAEAASTAHGATAERAARPTLLLIDDDADLGTVLEVSLSGSYRVLRVERGVQALDVARAERPDLILLDVVLPDLSGYDVLRILKHSEATRAIPVVMLTVQPERELARRLGAADVVAKPIDIDDLRRALTRTLAPRGATGLGLRVALGPLRSRTAGELAAALEAGGHSVLPTRDPWELLRCADTRQPDVAVFEAASDNGDARMVAFLRGHPSTRRLPLVLLTVHTGPFPSGCTAVASDVQAAEVVRVVEQAARQRGAAA